MGSQAGFKEVAAALGQSRTMRQSGRIASVGDGVVRIVGLGRGAAVGDRLRLGVDRGAAQAEIVGFDETHALALPDGASVGLAPGDAAILLGPARIAPADHWMGRVVDPLGRPLDGRPLLPGRATRALDAPAPDAAARRALGERVETGSRVFNTLLPLVRGQRLGLFAGSGVGKSTLLGGLARRVEADVVVLALIGERGRELRDFVENVLGPEGMARAVVVAATADAPAALRGRCAAAAMTVAEHFRDAGRHVLFMADSVTRMADAQRQVALARGEPACMGGYPASMAAEIMALCERAGPGTGEAGDITAILTVLVHGSDMEGPVADVLRGVLDGHVVLDREIAERGRFPAVDLLRSVSRALPRAASDTENTLIAEARRLMGAYERSEMMIRAGLYTPGSDAGLDAAIAAWPKLDAFIAQSEPGTTEDSFRALARCLKRE